MLGETQRKLINLKYLFSCLPVHAYKDLIQLQTTHYQMIKKMPIMTAKKIAVTSLNQNFTKLHSENKQRLGNA